MEADCSSHAVLSELTALCKVLANFSPTKLKKPDTASHVLKYLIINCSPEHKTFTQKQEGIAIHLHLTLDMPVSPPGACCIWMDKLERHSHTHPGGQHSFILCDKKHRNIWLQGYSLQRLPDLSMGTPWVYCLATGTLISCTAGCCIREVRALLCTTQTPSQRGT